MESKATTAVIYISSDHTRSQFEAYFDSMPLDWFCLEFQSPICEATKTRYDTDGIPFVVILDAKTGQCFTRDGRLMFSKWMKGQVSLSDFPWYKYR